LDEAEKLLISQSMKRNGGNMSAIAAELGISRPTLYSKIKKYGLE
jgi:transcriptional regulator with PAS, ATPase and Fis domain